MGRNTKDDDAAPRTGGFINLKLPWGEAYPGHVPENEKSLN
jgi:hypothetical protein